MTQNCARNGRKNHVEKSVPDFMDEAHEAVCIIAVELIGHHFMYPDGEARELLKLMPKLNDARLDAIVAAISNGADHLTDCPLEHSSYIFEILNSARRISSFDLHRKRIHEYLHLLKEYDLVNGIRAAWTGNNREMLRMLLGDLARLQQASPSEEALPLVCVAQAPEPPEPIFANGPVPGGFGLIVGADGIGKGWLILDILLSAALGRPMNVPAFRRTGTPLTTLYLSCEDDPRILRRRLDQIAHAAEVSPADWRDAERSGRLMFAADIPPLFITLPGSAIPAATETLQTLEGRIRMSKADLCVIDPFAAAVLIQSENDNSALNAVAVMLRTLAQDTGCTILLAHHTSKAARDGADHHAARGGSALTGAARWVLRLVQEANDRTRLAAGVPKNSYGRLLEPVPLQRLDSGVLRQLTPMQLVKQKERLVEDVVRFIREHPELEINPNAVRLGNSKSAKKMIAEMTASPGDLFSAIESAVKQGRLILEEHRRKCTGRPYFIVIVPDDNDQESIDEELF